MGNLASGAGWGWPLNSRKCHYFEQGVSLCGKWMFWGTAVENQSATKSADDCVACRRKLEAKTKTKESEGTTEVNP